MFRLAIVALAIAALLLSGCSQVAEKAVEQATGITVDEKKDSVTVKTKEGEQITVSSEMPAELKNFPVPSGFKLESSSSITTGAGKMSVAAWRGKGSADDVVAFYGKAARDRGWEEQMSFKDSNGGMHQYTDKDGKEYIVTYSTKSGGEMELSVVHNVASQ